MMTGYANRQRLIMCSGMLLLAWGACSAGRAQGIVEDTTGHQVVHADQSGDEEGSRYISAQSPIVALRHKAAAGTTAFFIAAGIDLTAATIMSFNPPKSQDEVVPYLLTGLGVGACIMSSVPATLAQVSGGVDVLRKRTGRAPRNTIWRWYGAGWAAYGAGTALNLVGSMEEAPQLLLVGSGLRTSGCILWGVACVRAVSLIRDFARQYDDGEEQHSSISFAPLIGPRRTVGLAVNGRF